MILVQSGRCAVPVEFELDLCFLARQRFAADSAGLPAPGSTVHAVGTPRGQLPTPDRLSSLLPKKRFVGHVRSSGRKNVSCSTIEHQRTIGNSGRRHQFGTPVSLRRALVGRGVEPHARVLPRDTARRVKPISLDFGRVASPPRELKFDFHLVESNRLAAKYAALSASAPAECADRRLRRQTASTNRFAGNVSKRAFVGHCEQTGMQDGTADAPLEIARNPYSAHPELPGNL
jgi:hypothetical protein